MGRANELHETAMTPKKNEMSLVFPADPMAVRRALKASMTGLIHLELNQDDKGVVELVLAEVLNNVVEHAYAHQHNGIMELQIKRNGHQLEVTVLDEGVPLPSDSVPIAPIHDLDVPVDNLPEGGFGWFLIKELTQNLQYTRCGTRNCLTFELPLQGTRVS